MHKHILSYITIAILGIGRSLANAEEQTIKMKMDSLTQANYLNQVGVYFINDKTKATPKEFNIQIDQDNEKTINLLLKNDSDTDLNLRIKFANQEETANGTQGCAAQYDEDFSRFITTDRDENILLPANSKQTKPINIKFPIGIIGLQKGCIAYGIQEDKKETNSMISIVTRKVIYLNSFVGGEKAINYNIDIGKIKKRLNKQNELEISFEIINKGNIPSKIQIDGKISNIFGYESNITLSGAIDAENSKTLTTTIGNLPSYGGLFTISTDIINKQHFLFDKERFGIKDNDIKENKQQINTIYIKRKWQMLIILIIIATMIYVKSRKVKKKTEQVI